MTKVGRNDPCPCGSGKKYKKCCLAKDEATARQDYANQAALQQEVTRSFIPAPLTAPAASPSGPADPLEQARADLWDAFEAAEPAKLPELFQRALAEPDLADSELAFEMICSLRDHHSRAVFTQALDTLEQRRPDLYQHDLHYYLDWRIADALASGDLAALPKLGTELAAAAGKDLDNFSITLDRLAYHGQLALSTQMIALAWPQVRAAEGLVSWAADEFAQHAQNLTLYAQLEQNPALSANDPQLRAALQTFAPFDPDHLAQFLDLLRGRAERHWSLDLFAFQRSAQRSGRDGRRAPDADPAAEALGALCLEFLGALQRDEGVPLIKGELIRNELARYLIDRHAGKLDEHDAPAGFGRRPKGKSSAPKASLAPRHPLCPDRTTLDRFLGGMLSLIGSQPYVAAALLELTPAWLRFLAERNLLTPEQHAAALDDLRKLVAEAAPIWAPRTDPVAAENIRLAWEAA
jgi:hypothetical protein